MADRAHIRHNGTDWDVIKKYNSEQGRVINEDGSRTSPVQIGHINGNDKVVAIEKVTNDTSTGTDILQTVVETIEGGAVGTYTAADRVLRTITIRDLTAQEIADRGTNIANQRFNGINDDCIIDAMRDVMHRYNNSIRVLEGKATWTKGEFNDWLKTFVQSSVDSGAS